MDNIKSKVTTLLITFTVGLSGCGSSSSDTNNKQKTTDNLQTMQINGVVVDGYLQNATVCLDLNVNGKCDDGEPQAKTSADGKYTLTIDMNDHYNYPVVAEIVAGETVDQDNPGVEVSKSYRLTSTLDKPVVISPLTTLIKGQVDKNASLSSSEAASLVSNELNITSDNSKLFSDYVASESSDNVSLKLHEVSKIVTKLIVGIEEKIKNDLNITTITDGQRAGLRLLINDIVFTNIKTIASKIENNQTVDEAAIINNTDKTQDDLDNATASVASKTISEVLKGKTLYSSPDVNLIERDSFSDDMSQATWEEVIGGSDSGMATISDITNDSINLTDSEGSTGTIKLVSANEEYIIVRIIDDGEETTQRWFFDIEKAKVYYGLTVKEVVTKTIAKISDWNDVDPIYSDAFGDTPTSGLDIVDIKIAQDDNNVYINLQRAGLDFPSSDYYYNYWIYFRADNKTFSLENFHDNQGHWSFRVYEGIGYAGGTEVLSEDKSANISDVNLQIVVPKSLNVIGSDDYTVSLFTHEFNKNDHNDNITNEKEDDSHFIIKF